MGAMVTRESLLIELLVGINPWKAGANMHMSIFMEGRYLVVLTDRHTEHGVSAVGNVLLGSPSIYGLSLRVVSRGLPVHVAYIFESHKVQRMPCGAISYLWTEFLRTKVSYDHDVARLWPSTLGSPRNLC